MTGARSRTELTDTTGSVAPPEMCIRVNISSIKCHMDTGQAMVTSNKKLM